MNIMTRPLAMIAAQMGLAAFIGLSSAGHAADQTKAVKALVTTTQLDASKPDAEVWGKAPATTIALQPAFSGHQSIVGTPRITQIAVQAVRSQDRLFVKLTWDDASANGTVGDTTQFADGVAVQFPVNGKAGTTPFMGDAKRPVNVWYWRANGHAEELVAAGFGSATSLRSDGEVSGIGARTANGWQVVLSRKLAGAKEGVNLKRFREIPIAFAAWDGSNQERDGLKAVTLAWQKLRL